MWRVKAFDPPRQQVWKHEGRTYSIVDLTILPWLEKRRAAGMEGIEQEALQFAKMMEFYKPYHFEVADITGDEPIAVLGRYGSYKEAQEAIRTGNFNG